VLPAQLSWSLRPGLPYDRQAARKTGSRYGHVHFDLDSFDSDAVTPDDPDRTMPNPAKKAAEAVVKTARKTLAGTEAECPDRSQGLSESPCRQDCIPTT
jgi:hypothetical protein